ncbi:hypothetical protein PHSY_000135 [Pseudozyma hubeiensis SY62]|uniref:DUF7702 domain-containing protein n=1 Tax=Pseudozyma hubeiensis (strain SY62) TaxID=1305764 RepID=R9NVW5_PSEHS|nr:hypothetical protein PHSY_000135 [Pseudozyma hubeiensis SY62]GAC92581.1 hypothetical protein PHSY_000135 [Pseudozyma hubeiensis SY62]
MCIDFTCTASLFLARHCIHSSSARASDAAHSAPMRARNFHGGVMRAVFFRCGFASERVKNVFLPIMTYSTATIINIAFIPLYLPLFVLNILNLVHHRPIRTSGYLPLLIVTVLHLVGNTILVVDYTRSIRSVNLTVWGFILQSIGLSPMISAVLAFYANARDLMGQGTERSEKTIGRVLNLINLAAMICIITGYTNTTFTDSKGILLSHPTLPIQTKIGSILYILLTATLLAITTFGLNSDTKRTRTIRCALFISTPLMIVRSAFAAYTTFSGSILVVKSIWAKLVLQYVSEFVALAVLTCLGLVIKRHQGTREEVVGGGGDDVESVARKGWDSTAEETQQNGKNSVYG